MDSIRWINSHLPEWKKRGMNRGFLGSIIDIDGYKIDVATAIGCNTELFGELYKKEEFIPKLKELCKRYRLPHGDRKYNEEEVVQFSLSRPKRVEKEKLSLGKVEYSIENTVENIQELVDIVHSVQNKTYGETGNKRLSITPQRLETFIDIIERKLPPVDMIKVLNLSEASVLRYLELLKSAKIINKTGRRKYDYSVNEDLVHYTGGRKHKKLEFEWDL